MGDSAAQVDELLKEKSRTFCGSAKVWLRQLRAEDVHVSPRQLDPKNVTRLLRIYQLEGCLRLEPEHHIPVIIEEAILESSLRRANVSRAVMRGLGEPMQLDFEVEVTYLHGQHRLAAAQNFLTLDDKWWVADLYLDQLSPRGRRAIREEYSNTLNFCDGDIFRQLRYCSLRNDRPGESKWLARLSDSKRRDIRQLQRSAERDINMRVFRDALDSLVPFTGLWPALKIGTFHRLLSLRCPEEMAHYLTRVRKTWACILNDEEDLYLQLDSHTVRILEGKCVRRSTEDYLQVEAFILQREIFPSKSFDTHRQNLIRRLRSIKHVIPTIHTFLEDTKYLELGATIMKQLLPRGFRGSVRQAFQQQHNGQKLWQEQRTEEDDWIRRAEESSAEACSQSYRQLWLFSWRHFPEMTGQPPRKDVGKPKPKVVAIEHTWWHRITTLAVECGYSNVQKLYSDVIDTDEKMARDFLRLARPAQIYDFEEDEFHAKVRRICQTLINIKPRQANSEAPTLSSDRHSCGPDISSRCGRPFEQSFENDRACLFPRYLFAPVEQGSKRFITSFAIKHDIFHAFLGGLDPNLSGPVPMSSDTENQLVLETEIQSPPTGSSQALDALSPSLAAGSRPASPHEHIQPGTANEPSLDIVRLPPTVGLDAVGKLRDLAPEDTLTILNPQSPIEAGAFRARHVNRDKNTLITALSIGQNRTRHVYIDFDGTSEVKLLSGVQIIRNPAAVRKAIISVPENRVENMKKLFENLSSKSDGANNIIEQY